MRPGSLFQTVQNLQEGVLDICFLPLDAAKGDGIMQRKLFSFRDVVYFDPKNPLPEDDLDAFCARPHARVALGPDASFAIDQRLAKMKRKRKVVLQVPDFDSALTLIKDTDIIVTLPDVLSTPEACACKPALGDRDGERRPVLAWPVARRRRGIVTGEECLLKLQRSKCKRPEHHRSHCRP